MILDPQDLLFLYFRCPCIFGYECPQIASGWGWKESDKGDFCQPIFSCLHLCGGTNPKVWNTGPLPSWVTLVPSVPHIEQLTSLGSSLFSLPLWIFHPYLAAWLSGIPKVMSVLTNWEWWHFELGSCCWVAIQAQGTWNPKSSFSLCLVFLCPLLSSPCYNPWAAHFVFCVFTALTAISHNWETSDLEKASNVIHIGKDFLLQMSRCPFKME